MNPVHVRLQRPRQPSWAPDRIQKRREQGDCKTSSEPGPRIASIHPWRFNFLRREKRARSNQHAHTKQVGPRRPAPRHHILLQAEQEPKTQDLGAAKNGLPGNMIRILSLLPQAQSDKSKRKAGQKQKRGRWYCAPELRPVDQPSLPRARREPRVVAVGLKHKDARQAAHPVDIAEPGRRRLRRIQRRSSQLSPSLSQVRAPGMSVLHTSIFTMTYLFG